MKMSAVLAEASQLSLRDALDYIGAENEKVYFEKIKDVRSKSGSVWFSLLDKRDRDYLSLTRFDPRALGDIWSIRYALAYLLLRDENTS